MAILAVLLVLNLRGVKESIKILMPIFLVFVATHFLLIAYGILAHAGDVPRVLGTAHADMRQDLGSMGWVVLLMVFMRAYSLGGGTYTGIEAVSNGLTILREPRVATGKRTMLYMALSLAFTAGGILVCYLLWSAAPAEGKTMNAVLLDRVFGAWTLGPFQLGAWLVVVTLLSEGALLFVAAQAGFIDGPRILSNMAVDSWLPHRFANLSERLVTQNGVLLMGIASGILIVYTKGQVSFLIVLYAINVFLTFSLTEMGMSRFWVSERKHHPRWLRNLMVHGTGLVMCLSILVVTTVEKFKEGGWLTFLITASFIALCFLIKAHYKAVGSQIRDIDAILSSLPVSGHQEGQDRLDPEKPVAALLVSGYGGLGIHSVLSILRLFPDTFRNILFVSTGVVDSGNFKGKDELECLKRETEESLQQYAAFARSLGLNADFRHRMGTEVVDEAEVLCGEILGEFPRAVFFLGKLIFAKEHFYYRLLHNDTAFAIQHRLQFAGMQTVVLPIRITMS